MDSVNNNMSASCRRVMVDLRDKKFVCLGYTNSRDIKFEVFSLSPTTVLHYGGPSLDTMGRPVHQFYLADDTYNEDYYEYDDYQRVFRLSSRDLGTVFVDSELVRKFARTIEDRVPVSVEYEGQSRTAYIESVQDKWPLTDDHDEIYLNLVDNNEEKFQISGTLFDLGAQVFGLKRN